MSVYCFALLFFSLSHVQPNIMSLLNMYELIWAICHLCDGSWDLEKYYKCHIKGDIAYSKHIMANIIRGYPISLTWEMEHLSVLKRGTKPFKGILT